MQVSTRIPAFFCDRERSSTPHSALRSPGTMEEENPTNALANLPDFIPADGSGEPFNPSKLKWNIPGLESFADEARAIQKQHLAKLATEEEEDQFKDPEDGTRLRTQLRVKIGQHIFDSQTGDFLGRWSLELSSYRHHTFKCVIYDPLSEAYQDIKEEKDIEVEIGFADGIRPNMFKGKIYYFGRVPPDGTEIEAVDSSFQMQASTGNTVQQAGESAGQIATGTDGELVDGMKIVQTLEGEASFYGGGDGFDGKKTANGEIFDATKLTAAHKELDFGTKCRVTNIENKKTVIVEINDRGPYAEDRIIDLSKAAAEQIGLVEKGHGKVKIEVLGDADSEQSLEQKQAESDTEVINSGESDNPPQRGGPLNLALTSDELSSSSAVDSFRDLVLLRDQTGEDNAKIKNAPSFAIGTGINFPQLKFDASSNLTTGDAGSIQIGQSFMNKAQLDAILAGKIVIARGDTVEEITPGKAPKSGITIDYDRDRNAFIGKPRIHRKTGVQLQSGFGALTVQGYSVNDGTAVSATVVTSAQPGPLPPGAEIAVPQLGTVKLEDPIYPGCPFTWAIATRNGERPADSQEVMEGIVSIAKAIHQILDQFQVTHDKAVVTSWYRPGSGGSYHTRGCAVDWYIDDGPGSGYQGFDYTRLYKIQEWALASFDGGVGRGIPYQGFLHLDTGPKRDWDY
jgi:rare lipoprotein A (peptidoglycan hydrolase)